MSVPVVFETAAGPFEIDRAAIEWLWEILDASELPATHAALADGLNGTNVTVPEGERSQFCARLGALAGRAVRERSPALAALRERICG